MPASCANNSRLRRAVMQILLEQGEMARFELMSKLSYFDNRLQPSAQSLASILTKTQAILTVGTTKVASSSGRMKNKPTFDIDRSYIFCVEDIVMSLPISSLYAYEAKRAQRCSQCNRSRILPEDSEMCLRCSRKEHLITHDD